MSIPINNQSQIPGSGANDARSVSESRGNRVAGVASEGRGNAAAGSGTGDQVTLTATARQLSDLAQTVSDQPTVDSSRVEALQAAIQEGRYEVNPERIAAQLMRTENSLP